jgi:DNA-binding LacI/PurR family transcriptional regulator
MQSLDILEFNQAATDDPSAKLHTRVRKVLRGAIQEHFEDGQRFWTENMLIEHLRVSQVTVRRALTELAQEGVLERRPSGSFVRKAHLVGLTDIGCFVPEYNSEFLNELLENLASLCREQNRVFRVHHTHRGENLNDIRRYLEAGPRQERFVLLGAQPLANRTLWDALDDRGYRAVCIDTPAEGRPANLVAVDNEAGIRLALQHLRDLGHRRIVFLANEPEIHPNVVARREAFLKLRAAWRLDEAVFLSCGNEAWKDCHQAAYRTMPELWQHQPTAIMTASDQGAWAAMSWLAERKIEVPSQVSIIGFDNVRHSQFTFPPLSSIAHPNEAMVRWAIQLLDHPASQPQELRLEPTLVLRRSTAPVAA